MFELMSVLFPIMFVLVLGFIIFSMLRGVGEWARNNQQPVLNIEATIVSKRTHVSRSAHHHADHHVHHHTSTTYYVTFQVESGDRMELRVPDREYGLLAEGDKGKLTFQGTRYHHFERYA